MLQTENALQRSVTGEYIPLHPFFSYARQHHRVLLYIYSYITGYFFIFIHNTNQTALSPGNICWLPASHRLIHHHHLRKQLCNYQNACFSPCPHENYPLFIARACGSIFSQQPPRDSATAQPPQSPRLSPDGHIPDYFLRFSPVVMPVKVVRCFHHQRRLRLTTSGGTFS